MNAVSHGIMDGLKSCFSSPHHTFQFTVIFVIFIGVGTMGAEGAIAPQYFLLLVANSHNITLLPTVQPPQCIIASYAYDIDPCKIDYMCP